MEVCITHIRNITILDNRQIDTDLWFERLSNQTKDVHQIAAHNQLKLTVLEQVIPHTYYYYGNYKLRCF